MNERSLARSTAELTDEDRAYIGANFVPLIELCRTRGERPAEVRRRMREGWLPLPAYVLDDGTEMVSDDYFALVDETDGKTSPRDLFVTRYRHAGAAHGVDLAEPAVEQEWRAYLSGEYAVCLWHATPENIFRKGWLTTAIEGLLAEARPGERRWRARLTVLVDELDALERDFAPYDRRRWGPVSRDRLITRVRQQYQLRGRYRRPPADYSRA